MSKRSDAMREAAETEANRHTVEQALRAQLKLAQGERDKLRSQLDLIESIEAHGQHTTPRWLTPKSPAKGHRATLNLLLTDTHFDEVVDPAQIDGLNAYNREIAVMRRTVGTFNALTGHALTVEEGALFMVCVKLSREVNMPKRDNLTDAAGYLECYARIVGEDA
jgi:hypothetical protein